ncbi:hypothetical protein [Nannocystis sp.]|uniref:hypothetical protein n=1 Tax=Nannocystis sp. TaxID=1962667 RepID=UPI0025DF79B0|nr:hypothetical protein [Nannocystis sp.]MBK7826148.1 hypothetical protein [Nannocystis sp.]
MKTRVLALPTLLLALVGVAQATRTLVDGDASEALGGGKLAQADRVVVYQLTRASGPRFRLPGGPEEVHLFVHLELPQALTQAAPEGRYRFGVVATLRTGAGEPLWERTLTERTRQTRDAGSGEGWNYEAAVAPEGRLELSDSVSVELSVPAAPVGAVLELRLADEAGLLADDAAEIATAIAGPTALVRAYRRIAVDPAETELRRLALAGDAGVRRLAAATYLPWYALPEGQQLQRLASAWERLAAEGRAGVDYEVRSIYLAPPHPPVAPPPVEPSLTIGRGQPVALQVVGPGALELHAWPIGQVTAGAIELRMRRISAGPTAASLAEAAGLGDRSGEAGFGDRSGEAGPRDRSGEAGIGDRSGEAGFGDRSGEAGPRDRSGEAVLGDSLAAGAGEAVEERRTLGLAGNERVREAIALGPGWWTIELHTELPAVAVQLRADAVERHAGPDVHAQHRDDAGRAFVPVDLRSLPLYRGGPGSAPLAFALQAAGDVDARLLEVELRALATMAPVELHYRFVDGEGRTLASGATLTATGVPAPFDRLRPVREAVPEDRSGAVGVAGFALAELAVSEPARLRLLAPLGAAGVQLWSVAPSLLAVHGRLPAPALASDLGPRYTWPYDQVEDPALRWRYVARAAPRGFPRRADDHAARVAAGELMLLQAQVRAEPAVAVEGERSQWRAQHPRGGRARWRLLERVPAERRGETLAHWGPGTYMRLRRGSAEVIDLGAGGPRPARAWYQATGSGSAVVGASMALALGGQALRWTISAREGRRPLPGRGAVELRWSEGPDDLLVLVDRPPGGRSGAPLYEHRQLHRLGPGGLGLTIEKPDAAPVVVNAVLYWIGGPPGEPTTLRVEIDGGQPRRREGSTVQGVTAGSRVLRALPTRRVEVVLPDRRGVATAGVARVAVALGDDLAPGRHTIKITAIGGPATWLRFFRVGVADVRGGALQWNERRDGVSLEDSDDEEE